jgi:quercetin dioxygenase-like cupin family protein
MLGPAQIFIKATGEHTGVRSFLPKARSRPGSRVRRRTDTAKCMTVRVLEGTLTLRLGAREVEARPGPSACVPPGVVHTFRNDSDGPVRLLNFNAPAGFHFMAPPRAAWR